MSDIKNEILSKYFPLIKLHNRQVPRNCAAGRCGHISLPVKEKYYSVGIVNAAMDEYAERILKWLKDNGQDLSGEDFDVKEYLQEIKDDLNKSSIS